VASGALGGALAPSNENVQLGTFAGQGFNVDPTFLLRRNVQDVSGLRERVKNRADTPPVLRSAFIQQPPVFAGGGLPLPIGVTGTDPALADPSLLAGIPEQLGVFNTNPPGGGQGFDDRPSENNPNPPVDDPNRDPNTDDPPSGDEGPPRDRPGFGDDKPGPGFDPNPSPAGFGGQAPTGSPGGSQVSPEVKIALSLLRNRGLFS